MKTIDVTLLASKAKSATLFTNLLLVGPLDDGSYRGFTELDKPVRHSPSVSIGEIVFKARTGFEMSTLEATNDMGVNNAEATSLAPVAGFEFDGFTQAQIDSGVLDKVKFVVLRVDYTDMTTGRSEVMAGGTIGEVRQKFNGLMSIIELRSLSQQLRQKSIVELDSTTCRARFGSGGSSNAIVERFPCGYDAESEWVAGTVTSVGAETDRQFSDTALLQADDYFAPGKVEFLTGDNAGQQVEIESFSSGGIVELKFPTVHAIQTGDTFQIRRGCTKRWTGHNSCETYFGADKVDHFRGEPHIPVGQTNTISVPGAGVPGGTGGATQIA